MSTNEILQSFLIFLDKNVQNIKIERDISKWPNHTFYKTSRDIENTYFLDGLTNFP